MQKFILLVGLLLALCIQLNAKEDFVLKELKSLPILNKKNIQILKYENVGDGFFIIKARTIASNGASTNVTFFTNKKVLFVGKGFDLESKKELILFNKKKVIDNIVYTTGNKESKQEFFLVTDLECPYCLQFEDSLSNNLDTSKFKLNVLFYPLSFHLYAPSASQYILSLDQNKRAIETKNIMNLIRRDLSEAIKRTERFNYDFYGRILNLIDSPRISKYKKAIKKAYNIEQLSNKEFKKWLMNKISQITPDIKTANLLKTQYEIGEIELGVKGTPSLYDNNFNKVDIRTFYNIFKKRNYKALLKNVKTKQYIPFGTGKEPLYIVLSTKCSHCKTMINNKKLMNKIKSKYDVKFFLMPLSNNINELNEIKKIYTLPLNKRFNALEKAMNGRLGSISNFNSINLDKYFNALDETGINQTPTIINKYFKEDNSILRD